MLSNFQHSKGEKLKLCRVNVFERVILTGLQLALEETAIVNENNFP